MPHWKLKAAVQGTLARLPASQRWNHLFQRYITRSLDLTDGYFLEKWRQSERHAEHLREAGKDEGHTVVELGTGWFPINSIALALLGAATVYTVDRQSLATKDRVNATLEMFRRHLGAEVALSDSAAARLEDALGQARTLEAHELMALVGVTCLVTDARNLDLPPGSVDAFVSNNTLEHIPVDVIAATFQEFHRLGTPDCIMSHYIDLADHYAGFDGNIGVLNFLQYSERRWHWYNNDLQYQNRLRVNEYRAIHERSGWQVVREESTSADVSELRKLRLAPEFRGRREEDLVVYQSWMVSKPVRA